MPVILKLLETRLGAGQTPYDGKFVVFYEPTFDPPGKTYVGGILEVSDDPRKAIRYLRICTPFFVRIRSLLEGLSNDRFRFLVIQGINAAKEYAPDEEEETPATPPDGAPLNVLIPAKGEETDRRLRVIEAPAYGIVGKSVTLRVAIDDLGVPRTNTETANLTIRRDGEAPQVMNVPIGVPQSIQLFGGSPASLAVPGAGITVEASPVLPRSLYTGVAAASAMNIPFGSTQSSPFAPALTKIGRGAASAKRSCESTGRSFAMSVPAYFRKPGANQWYSPTPARFSICSPKWRRNGAAPPAPDDEI